VSVALPLVTLLLTIPLHFGNMIQAQC